MNKEIKQKKPPKTVTISMTKGFEEEYFYFQSQSNKSLFIWNLIRKDMKQQSTDNQILEIVRQAMFNITLGGTTASQPPQVKKVDNSTDLKRKKGAMSILSQ